MVIRELFQYSAHFVANYISNTSNTVMQPFWVFVFQPFQFQKYQNEPKSQNFQANQVNIAQNETDNLNKGKQVGGQGTISNQNQRNYKQKQLFCLKSQKLEDSVNQKTKKTKKSKQNIFRNILPNIIHQIFCFIQIKKRSVHIVEQFLQNLSVQSKVNVDIDRFYLYQRLIKQKLNHYVNVKKLKQLNRFQDTQCLVYSQLQQLIFIRMNRILVKHFLQHEFNRVVLTSTRMKSETRTLQFKAKRMILEQLRNIWGSIQGK